MGNATPRMAMAIAEYVDSSGESVNHPHAESLVVLYTKGRRSGLVRGAPLVAFPDGPDLLVMGSRGGAPRHPSWYLNLVDDPDVWVRNKDELYEASARTLSTDERAVMWSQITGRFPFYAGYQAKIERQIPVVRLTRKT